MARRSKLSLFIIVFFVAALVFGAFLLFQDTDAPEIALSHQEENISPNLPVIVTVSDGKSAIKRVSVVVRFKENVVPVLAQEYAESEKSRQISFTLAEAGLKNGDVFDLEITAVDASFGGLGFGNKSQLIKAMRLDTTPPRTSVKASVPYVRRGGTGCTVYSISKDVLQTGVKVGDYFFPAFRRENGDYLCFFAFPYFMEAKDYLPQLVALDKAGNLHTSDLPITRMPRQFKSDTINISQSFLNDKAAEFETMHPGAMTDIERFLIINGDERRSNALALLEIGRNTASEMLWQGAFLRLPRAASRAGFADHRTYLWEGQKVDEQTHLGFDLASTKQAPIPTANKGNVVYAGYLGIYGNLVIIDHGLGLQSLYSHMSEISVEAGQAVEKGHIIGKTGASGMAGGDHLHFGILIAGLEVTPLEWLDDHWIKDNIIDRIKEAGGTAPAFEVEQPSPSAAPSNKKPAAKKPTTPRKR